MSGAEASQQANRAQMDPRRLVVIAYLLLGVIVAVTLSHLLGPLFARFKIGGSQLIEGVGIGTAEVAAFTIAAGLVIIAWRREAVRSYSEQVATELMRVTWPTFDDTRVSTLGVIIASVLAGVILFLFDSLSYKIMIQWLPALLEKL